MMTQISIKMTCLKLGCQLHFLKLIRLPTPHNGKLILQRKVVELDWSRWKVQEGLCVN